MIGQSSHSGFLEVQFGLLWHLYFYFLLVYSIITEITLPDLPDWIVGILGTVIGFYFGAAMTSGPMTLTNHER